MVFYFFVKNYDIQQSMVKAKPNEGGQLSDPHINPSLHSPSLSQSPSSIPQGSLLVQKLHPPLSTPLCVQQCMSELNPRLAGQLAHPRPVSHSMFDSQSPSSSPQRFAVEQSFNPGSLYLKKEQMMFSWN